MGKFQHFYPAWWTSQEKIGRSTELVLNITSMNYSLSTIYVSVLILQLRLCQLISFFSHVVELMSYLIALSAPEIGPSNIQLLKLRLQKGLLFAFLTGKWNVDPSQFCSTADVSRKHWTPDKTVLHITCVIMPRILFLFRLGVVVNYLNLRSVNRANTLD